MSHIAMSLVKLSFLDKIVCNVQKSLLNQSLSSIKDDGEKIVTDKALPFPTSESSNLTSQEQAKSIAFMRINHTGEVCAQGLYDGQAISAHSKNTKQFMKTAAMEETQHLHWCSERIKQLQGRESYLNPFWYWASFCIGIANGILGDKWSFGFVVATEEGVAKHLQKYIKALPDKDITSKQILQKMLADEISHRDAAYEKGSKELPKIVKLAMRLQSKVMTGVTYYI
ncbi:MAG: demethoxyubiquinone hydroxylase family protein [Thiotrichales bacterium]|nr:MAG: demethoxyubiquinone hydroxylase family protein [Thiotrichales bacterium]